MYLQGNLQTVFDALYHLGVIDPVLEMDWAEAMNDFSVQTDEFNKALSIANSCQRDLEMMMKSLEEFDDQTLSFLAMEVAREFADFHSREDLH